MNKVLPIILAFFASSFALATDIPAPCTSKEAYNSSGEILAGLNMPNGAYEIATETDGEIFYITVTVPTEYKGIKLNQINLKRVVSGQPVLAAGLSFKIKNDMAISSAVLVWPSEINAVGFNVQYANYQHCAEGYDLLIESSAYDLEYKHNNSKQQGPAAGTR